MTFNETHLTLKLHFNSPNEVSIRFDPNILKIVVWNSKFFVREKDGYWVPPESQVEKQLPRMVDEKIAKITVEIAKNIENVAKGVTFAALVLAYFMNFGMS